MDALTIILLCVIAGLVVGIVVCLVHRNKRISAKSQEWKLEKEQLQNDLLEKENRASELKNEYEKVLSEAKSQIDDLDNRLKLSIEGNLDVSIKEKLAEAEQLKKKIKELQEEIEDNEEELEERNKRLKKEKEGNVELQNRLDVEAKNSKRVREELENVKSELDDRTKELELKIQSILFVQEVLTATPVLNADTKGLCDKVENIYNFIRGDLRDCVVKLFSLTPDSEDHYFGNGLERWATVRKKDWIQGKTAIAFVGEFSAGKTSIVNRILSQDNPDVPLLPVSAKATTAVSTYISGGVATQFNFVTPDNVQKNISEAAFRRVNKEVLEQVKGVSSLLQYFVMRYKNENLNNLSILDTPGFSSNDKEDAERTIEVINECDALFWVSDVNAGTINRSSIRVIRDNLKKPLYVVINKVDTKAKKEVDEVEKLIRQTLKEEGVQANGYIRFSPTTPLDEMMNVIGSVTRDGITDSYLDDLIKKMDDLETELDNLVKEANGEHKKLSKACDKLVNKYIKSMDRLRDACVNAADKPQRKSTWFGLGDDVFKMTEGEYSEFIGLLEDISEDCLEELAGLYDEQMETQRAAQQAYSDYVDRKTDRQEMSLCNKQLKKHINLLKKKK